MTRYQEIAKKLKDEGISNIVEAYEMGAGDAIDEFVNKLKNQCEEFYRDDKSKYKFYTQVESVKFNMKAKQKFARKPCFMCDHPCDSPMQDELVDPLSQVRSASDSGSDEVIIPQSKIAKALTNLAYFLDSAKTNQMKK